ncbi:hypothetical protein [Fluviicola sp.]|uniref:hypothetical protein n=1 Tax=Fluviicola sp. TaxID=1917219 RepID=UPI003D2804A5
MADGKYGFDLKVTDSTGLCSALLSYSQKELSYLYLIGCTSTGASHKISSYDVSEENLTIHYVSDPYADTVSGTFIFKLIEE